MGTENGGLLLNFKIGKIEEGYKADFVGIDLEDLSMMPLSESLEQMLPNIVYSMEPTAIRTVVVAGNPTVKDGQLITVSEREISRRVKETMKRLNS